MVFNLTQLFFDIIDTDFSQHLTVLRLTPINWANSVLLRLYFSRYNLIFCPGLFKMKFR